MKQIVNVDYKENMLFEANVDGHKLLLDTVAEHGGADQGPRPKSLLLAAIAACSGMDVVSILKKMKVEYNSLQIRVEGDVAEEHPKKIEAMKVIFQFKGKDLPLDKIDKAVRLSENTYCGVNATFKPQVDVEYLIELIDEE